MDREYKNFGLCDIDMLTTFVIFESLGITLGRLYIFNFGKRSKTSRLIDDIISDDEWMDEICDWLVDRLRYEGIILDDIDVNEVDKFNIKDLLHLEVLAGYDVESLIAEDVMMIEYDLKIK